MVESKTKIISGLIVVVFALLGLTAFYPYYVETDRCQSGYVYGTWENLTEVIYFNDEFPALGRYYCDIETDMSQSECLDVDKLLNPSGCKWGGKTSKSLKTLYVVEDPLLGYNKTDWIPSLLDPSICAPKVCDDCELTLEFNNPTGAAITLTPALLKKYFDVKIINMKTGSVVNYTGRPLYNYNKTTTEPIYGDVEYSYTCSTGSFNYTTGPVHGYCWSWNESIQSYDLLFDHIADRWDVPSATMWWNESKIVDWDVTVVPSKKVFTKEINGIKDFGVRFDGKDVVPVNYVWQPGVRHNMTFYGKLKFGESVDVVPFGWGNFFYDECAVWNSSDWTYYRNITGEGVSDYALSINNTAGFNNEIIWTDAHYDGDALLYYIDTGSSDNYSVANETTEANYETEGTGLNNSPTSIYNSNVVAVWHLNGTKESSGKITGSPTVSGATQVAGCKYSGCYNFDGTDDYIEWAYDSDWQQLFNGGGTIMMWLYITKDAGSYYIVDNKGSGQRNFIFWLVGSNKLRLFHDWTSDGSWTCDDTMSNLTWHHVAITYNSASSANNPLIYIDGSACSSITEDETPSGSAVYADMPLRLGCHQGTCGSDSFIRADEFRLYGSILPASVISELYNNSLNSGVGSMKLGVEESITVCTATWDLTNIFGSDFTSTAYYNETFAMWCTPLCTNTGASGCTETNCSAATVYANVSGGGTYNLDNTTDVDQWYVENGTAYNCSLAETANGSSESLCNITPIKLGSSVPNDDWLFTLSDGTISSTNVSVTSSNWEVTYDCRLTNSTGTELTSPVLKGEYFNFSDATRAVYRTVLCNETTTNLPVGTWCRYGINSTNGTSDTSQFECYEVP